MATVADSIRSTLARINHALNAQAAASGSGLTADFKYLCDSSGEVRIDSFASSGGSFQEIVQAAQAAGFNRPNADYTIFFDAGASERLCGIASYMSDERLTPANASNTGGGYAVTYEPCWTGSVAMHEIAHNQGAVPYGAPNSTGSGAHCDEGEDVLCYTPDGGDRNQGALTVACSSIQFDCNSDDYFDVAPQPGEYLAAHWNLGSPLNRFIAFGAAVLEPVAEADSTPPPSCQARRCATPLRLGVPAHGEVRAGAATLYRLPLHQRLRSLRVVVRADAPLSVAIRRRMPPRARPVPACGTSRPNEPGGGICTVHAPASGPWFLSIRAATDADVRYALAAVGAKASHATRDRGG